MLAREGFHGHAFLTDAYAHTHTHIYVLEKIVEFRIYWNIEKRMDPRDNQFQPGWICVRALIYDYISAEFLAAGCVIY